MLSLQRAQRLLGVNTLAVRTLKKSVAMRKPKFQLKFDLDGNPVVPEKISGWDSDERENYVKWLQRTSEKIASEIGQKSGDRFVTELTREVKNYVASYWGQYQAKLKAVVRAKRARSRKIRRNKLMFKKMNEWQLLEDKREDKILRDRARAERELKHEPFTMNNFLRAKREEAQNLLFLDVPADATPEQEIRIIEAAVEADRQKYLVKPPKTVRRVHHFRNKDRLGYMKRLEREVVDPWVHEIRRRARVADIVEKYEEAFRRARWLAERRQAKIDRENRKYEEWLKRREHWHKVLGEWHAEQNRVRALQIEFMQRRQAMYANARAEFLRALNDDVVKWVETPNECRYLRFRFVEGVEFPFNKSGYI